MCGGNYIVRTRNYVGLLAQDEYRYVRQQSRSCHARKSRSASSRRSVGICFSPEMVEITIKIYRAERERLAREQAKTRAESESRTF